MPSTLPPDATSGRSGRAVAVGVDIVEISRISRLLEEHPGAEAELFTAAERSSCTGRRRRMAGLAARFAAKEAVLKALGTGLGPGQCWHDVEVHNDPTGRPHIRLSGLTAQLAAAARRTVVVSLSHTATMAIAEALLLEEDPTGTGDTPARSSANARSSHQHPDIH